MLVGLTLLCRSLFAISPKTESIIRDYKGLKAIDSGGRIHITTVDHVKSFGKSPVFDRESKKWIMMEIRTPMDDENYHTYEVIDTSGRVIIPKRRLVELRRGGMHWGGESIRGVFPELKPNVTLIIGGSPSGFDQSGMLHVIELDNTGNVLASYYPLNDCTSFYLLWNGKQFIYLDATSNTFMVYKENNQDFEQVIIDLDKIGFKKLGKDNYLVSEEFRAFFTSKGDIAVIMRSADPDDFDEREGDEHLLNGRNVVGIFIVSQNGKIVSPIKKYDIRKSSFKILQLEDGFDGKSYLDHLDFGKRICIVDSTVYVYFRGYDVAEKEVSFFQMRLTQDGKVMIPPTIEPGQVKHLDELANGFQFYQDNSCIYYSFDTTGDIYLLINEEAIK